MVIKYLIGISKEGINSSYEELDNYMVDELKEINTDDKRIYKVVEIDNVDVDSYKIMENACNNLDLFDAELDKIIESMKKIEKSSVTLTNYLNNL